jgi:flagellar biosynthetic protein FlhB
VVCYPFIDLQWFASAAEEGRTEEATPEKIRRAREEDGTVAKSQDLVAALVLLLPAAALIILSSFFMRNIVEMLRFFLTRAVKPESMSHAVVTGAAFSYFVKLTLPLLAAAFLAGLLANIAQVGWFWTTKPLAFKGSRIAPNLGKYFQRTLFSASGVVNFGKSILKMLIVGVVVYVLIKSDFDRLENLQEASLWTGFTFVCELAAKLLVIVGILLLVLSIPDYIFQRWQWKEQLKMTPQEFKEEMKQEEGDPQVKQRLRARMQDLLRKSLREVVPEANVILTNPTHLSVALRYNPEKEEAPRVLVKGADEAAFAIRRVAREAGVPIEENKPLARAIYAEVDEGDIVPQKFWAAIIVIMQKVLNVNELRRRMANG